MAKGKGSSDGKSGSDLRSNVKNPNNPGHKSAGDNRANQKNPNHAPSKGK